MITYHSCSTDDELSQILNLQQQNLPSNVSEDETKTEGFVTVEHTLELLKKMNDACPHSVAKDGTNIVGYALSMHPKFGDEIEVLQPMFAEINTLFSHKKEMLKQFQHNMENYVIMGQVCIALAYRKRGVFRKLYEFMHSEVMPPFSCIITEVNSKNTRSLNAHYAIGFQKMSTYHSNGQNWELIYLK